MDFRVIFLATYEMTISIIFGLIGGICAKKFQNEFYSVLYNDIRTTHL